MKKELNGIIINSTNKTISVFKMSGIEFQHMSAMYDISEYGFLPKRPHNVLPINFKCFQNVIDHLEENKNANGESFRQIIDDLPKYDKQLHSTEYISDTRKRYMYSILCMIMNRYIWCTGVQDAQIYSILPPIIGIPLYEISNYFGIASVLTHAAVDLWNWEIVDTQKPFGLDNIRTFHTMTGNPTESWFYKVMIAIEGVCGNFVRRFPFVHKYSDEEIIMFLDELASIMNESANLVDRMYDGANATFFFNNLRIYLSGSTNDNLPNGVTIDMSPIGQESVILKYKGGSAAQSTLIQAICVFLGIGHDSGCEFLTEMQTYMPKKHRDYLHVLSQCPSIRDMILASDNVNLKISYNKCIRGLCNFRSRHLGLVKTYIMKFIGPSDDVKDDIKNDVKDIVDENKNAQGAKGTGGTDPFVFCNGLIDETKTFIISEDHKKCLSFGHMQYIIFSILTFITMWYVWQSYTSQWS